MFKMINSNLFDVRSEADHNDYGDFIKTEILSSRDIESDQIRTLDRSSQTQRTLLRIVCPTKNYNEFKHSMSSRVNQYGAVSVLLKSDERNNYDSNIFAVAFPFNGIIEPIPESKQYRIWKGLIVPSSEFSIDYNGKKYKKILYLIIEPHMNILNPEHEHHVPSIDIPITSYSFVMRNDEKVTTKEVMTISIDSENAGVTWTSEKVEETDVSRFKGTPLYVAYSKNKSANAAVSNRVQGQNRGAVMTEAVTQPVGFGPRAGQTATYQAPGKKPFFKDESSYKDKDYDDNRPGKKTGNRGKKSKKRH